MFGLDNSRHAVEPDLTARPAILVRRFGGEWSRSRRVVLLVASLLALNVFDLVCTISVKDLGAFEEANPIARQMLEDPVRIIGFKLSMVAFATIVLLKYRRYRFVELATWAVCTVYLILGLIWLHHLQQTISLKSFLLR